MAEQVFCWVVGGRWAAGACGGEDAEGERVGCRWGGEECVELCALCVSYELKDEGKKKGLGGRGGGG